MLPTPTNINCQQSMDFDMQMGGADMIYYWKKVSVICADNFYLLSHHFSFSPSCTGCYFIISKDVLCLLVAVVEVY